MRHVKRHYLPDYLIRESFFILVLLFLLTGCIEDVPHGNPLDPQNSSAAFTVSGTVLTYYQPRTAVKGAELFLEPGNHIARASDDGSFSIKGVKKGRYMLRYGAGKYQQDSLEIEVLSNVTFELYLNGLPYFVRNSLITHHVARWFPLEDIYYLYLETSVNDWDGPGDLKNVLFRIPELQMEDTLRPGTQTGIFNTTLFEKDLSISSFQKLIGRPFYFQVEDEPGAVVISDPLYMTRIIEKTASVISPAELETVRPDSIHFRWELNPLPYEYTVKIDVFAINAGIPAAVESINNISSETQEWLYSSSLPAGDYFWTVTIVDRYGNTSRSKEGVFNVL